jgi:subtilisin family serine protease
MARRTRRRTRLLAAGAAMLACAGLAVSRPSSATSTNRADSIAPGLPLTPHRHSPVAKIASSLLGAHGRQTVFVQLSGSGAAVVSKTTLAHTAGSRAHRRSAARAAARARQSSVAQAAGAVFRSARQLDGHATKLYTVSNALPAVAMTVDASALAQLAARPDVVKILPITPESMVNASSAQLTRVLDTWQQTHDYGAGVRVGIIDSGIDFTHADFGGTGTSAAYTTAEADPTDPNWLSELPALAQAKIAGGYDFVGDAYNASSPNPLINTPSPDPDPIDCDGHGTHVAGTLAGYGVNSDGSTFTGDYSTLSGTDLYNMAVGPGMAPQAEIYALKVFGCSGSTAAVPAALDWALDPNRDQDFSDHLNIVNLSLESDFSTPDDAEAAMINADAALGVLTVAAAGNGGDQTDAAGAPGNAVRALDVASSVDEYDLHDGLAVDGPSGVVSNNIADGQNSTAYSYTANPNPVSGSVAVLPADPGNADGCESYSSDQGTAVSGKVVWVPWDDDADNRRCTSTTVADNAAAAGAIGVILTSTADRFPSEITGDATVPLFQLTMADTTALRQYASGDALNVTFDGALADTIKDKNPAFDDMLSSFSARGPHGSIGVVKPDVTAPGDTIASAAMGTGTGVAVMSGTSMASPNVAGIAALVEAKNPSWTVEQVKAAIMNTAAHNLYTGENGTGDIYGPNRVGAGRVDAFDAVNTSVLAYDLDTVGAVSASFGVVEASIAKSSVTATRTIRVENDGASPVTLSASYTPAVTQPGVSYTVTPSTSNPPGAWPTIPAAGSANLTVTMTITPTALRHTIDPTEQTSQDGLPRQYLSDASGWVTITGAGPDNLRVPVYGAAKPISTITTTAGSISGTDGVKLAGSGFNELSSGSTGYTSLVSVMDLGATSPQLPACASNGDAEPCTSNQTATGGDIHYVGAGSDPGSDGQLSDGLAYFGIATYGDAAAIGRAVTPSIGIDTNNDGTPDFRVVVDYIDGTDVLQADLTDLRPGSPTLGQVIDSEPVNDNYGNLDTNVFDTDVVIVPVSIAKLGAGVSTIRYTVTETSKYGDPADGGEVDSVGPVTYNVLAPKIHVGIATGNGPLFLAQGGTVIPAQATGPSEKALVFDLDNATGKRASTVALPWSMPGAPTQVLVTAQHGSVQVTWAPPASDGGASVQSYQVRYRASTTSTWTNRTAAASARSFTITGLTSTQVYAVQVAAVNGAGTSAFAAAAPASIRPLPDTSTVTISAAATRINHGGKTTIRGVLTDSTAHTAIAGATMVLYGRLGNGSFTKRSTRTTGSGGAASVSISPTGTTTYYWRYAGTAATHQSAASPTVTVTVAQVVHAASTRASVRSGVMFQLYGTVDPAARNQPIRIQQLVNGSWARIHTVTTRRQRLPNGRTAVGYIADVTMTRSGRVQLRASWPASVAYRAGGVSAACTVTVT